MKSWVKKYPYLSTVSACANNLQSFPLAHGMSNNAHSWCRICVGSRDACVEVSRGSTELTTELEPAVTADGRPGGITDVTGVV